MQHVALASAAARFRAALLDARLRSRRVERLALEAEAEARRDDALAKTDAGDFARAADALARLDEALAAVAERAGDEDADPESNVPPADHHPDASAAAAASALRLRALRRDAADLREFLRERVVAAFEESVWVEETDDGSFAIVADPLRAERAWADLRTAGDEAAGGAARELGDRLAMDFFLPLVDAAADEGAVVRCVVERVEVMHNRGGAEEDDAMTEKTAEEGLEVERDESKGGVVSLRRLRWTTDGERGAPDEVVVPALASALETSLRFATGAMGATRLCAYSRAVGAVAWGAVAAAAQARWFADADFDHEFDSSRADEDLAADSAAIDAPSSGADVFLLSDACVDALCAAEAAAASAGWAPAPPATGPLEAAARARDRGIEGAIRAEVLADARRVFVDATDAELYATFRAGAESEAIEANRRQSPMSWDPSKEDAGVFFSNPSERDDSSSPGNTGNTTKTAPALAASTVSTVARRLADVAVGALESAVGAASTELDASAKRGTPPNRAALVRLDRSRVVRRYEAQDRLVNPPNMTKLDVTRPVQVHDEREHHAILLVRSCSTMSKKRVQGHDGHLSRHHLIQENGDALPKLAVSLVRAVTVINVVRHEVVAAHEKPSYPQNFDAHIVVIRRRQKYHLLEPLCEEERPAGHDHVEVSRC